MTENDLNVLRFVLRETKKNLEEASTDWDKGYYQGSIGLIETILKFGVPGSHLYDMIKVHNRI